MTTEHRREDGARGACGDCGSSNVQTYDDVPIPMRLPCPSCGVLHLDVGEFATKVHHTHACQECGMVWRPAVVPTAGVAFLPGFKNEEATAAHPPSVPDFGGGDVA